MECTPPTPIPFVFPIDRFLSEFPEFNDTSNFPLTNIARCGKMASRYITEWRCGFPLQDPEERLYALFLMTAHLLLLRKNTADDIAGGNLPSGGRVKKAVVGAVTVETDTPNTYRQDDYTFWLSQTTFGQELLSYLESAAPAGLFTNCMRDTVRVL